MNLYFPILLFRQNLSNCELIVDPLNYNFCTTSDASFGGRPCSAVSEVRKLLGIVEMNELLLIEASR